MKLKHPSFIYWIVDLLFVFDIIGVTYKGNSGDYVWLVGLCILGLGLTLIHQFYDELEYQKGMFGWGQVRHLAKFTYPALRWLVTLFAIFILLDLFSVSGL